MPSLPDSLKNAAAYPHETGAIELLQTHISYLFVAGVYVYKIKKPVDFGFLDFTTLAKRKYYCEEELRLNRRLCPEIYLAVVPVKQRGEDFYVAGESGATVEYAVKMLRMPAERMMNNLISAGKLTPVMIDNIVDKLVPFYRAAAGDAEITRFGGSASVGRNFRENFQQTEAYVGGPAIGRKCFSEICSYAEDFLAREDLFRTRQVEGWIRDGHGDLHSANICLNDEIHIFDCIEFNRRLRYCDVASDVAFLAMDLDYYDLGPLSDRFVTNFGLRFGDPGLYTMLNFYKCYRACVRGKINLFTANDPGVDEQTRALCLKRAGRYFELARRYGKE